ncbi:MAG: M23 family metallopeptidase [Thermomonas sp.]
MRGLMLFVLGGLVGANATYYLMSRGGQAARAPVVVASPNASTGMSPGEVAQQPRETPPILPAPVASMRGTPPATTWPPSSATALLIPVQGVAVSELSDTFTDTRSAGRSHDAIDIMAPDGTPVLAVADGHVEKLFTSKLGGLTIYEFNADNTLAYYYAHLQRYADGLAEQQTVKRGQLIGYVGSTGDASPEAPHLHFAITVLGPEKKWWQGEAVNPYPQLGGTPH